MNKLSNSLKLPLWFIGLPLFFFCLFLPDGVSVNGLAQQNDNRRVTSSTVQNGQPSEKSKEREERGDRPDEALRFRRLQLQNEHGFIPTDGIEKARGHVRLMKQARQERLKSQRQPGQSSKLGIEAAGIEPDSWEWLGPGNIGGRIRSIVIHPTNPNNMWVGSVSGGIWRTTNAGASWQPVNDFMANLAVSTMVINPVNPNVMYAGTGESFVAGTPPGEGFAPDGLQGLGVFRSTDGGVTWDQLASTNPANPSICPNLTTCPWLFVNRLAISPNGSTILAATNNGIWRTTDGGLNWGPTGGVIGALLDIDFHPLDNQRAIASGNGAAIFSTNGGLNWTFATSNPGISGRVELAYAPNNPSIVYASVNRNNGEIFRSTNSGENYPPGDPRLSYTLVNTGNSYLGSQGGYDNIIWVNPLDANFVIVGGIDLWRSTNGGTTLTRISQWQNAPASAHADHHMIVAHPGFNNNTNRTVFFGNDGGIYRSDNVATVGPTTGWVELNNNLGITQFYGAAGNLNGVIIGGTQDNGTVTNSGVGGPESWFMSNGGDGGFCAADPTDPNFFYAEYIYLQLFQSRTGGVNFNDISFGIADANNSNTANFIAPFILDPNNANSMLAGGISLWRTANLKAQFIPSIAWMAIKPPTFGNSPISAIAIAPGNSNIIWVGHNNGDVFRTTNGGTNWVQVDGNTPGLPNRFVTRLVIHPANASIIYATFGGFAADNVYRTTDSGAHWVDVSGNGVSGLPNVPVRSLVFHPIVQGNLLYVGTELGVFSSNDGGENWSLPQDGPANVSVDELFWIGENLYAATHGRGIYRASGGIYVDRNNFIPQDGTFEHPFNTVAAGVNAVTRYRAIWIRPGNYNEPMTINKRLELRSFGGPVIIGKP